jgi:hypothetical protein
MARKNLWTPEELAKMAQEISEKKAAQPSYTAKDYAADKQIVYGTLYQALRRNGMFKPSRIRKPKTTTESAQPAKTTGVVEG